MRKFALVPDKDNFLGLAPDGERMYGKKSITVKAYKALRRKKNKATRAARRRNRS